MTTIKITDIKCSKWDIGQDIITVVIKNPENEDLSRLLDLIKKLCQCQMILESAIAVDDFPHMGAKKGDLYIKVQSSIDHGLKVGDELVLDTGVI